MSSLWRRQIVTAARPFLPHFPHAFPAFPAVPFGLAGVGAVGLTPLGQKCLSADRTGPQLRGDAFRCQRRLKLRVKGQDTTRWLARCKDEMARLNALPDTVNREQLLFGINQGAIYEVILLFVFLYFAFQRFAFQHFAFLVSAKKKLH